jgi:hypothetical protein
MGETPRLRRRIWTIQLIALTALVMVLATGTVALGGEGTVEIDEGFLVLQLGPDGNQFVWDHDADGIDGDDAAQAITSQGCRASLDQSGSILASVDAFVLDGSGVPDLAGADLGIFDDGLGARVQGSGGNGQPCGRADGPDEGLVVTLAGDLADMAITEAQIDIEGKFNVVVVGELYRGVTHVGTVERATGELSDSGPDSTDGDNYRCVIDVGEPFDTIVMTVHNDTPDGAFSLHGGADGTEPGSFGITETAFELVSFADGIVACSQSTITEGDAETTPEAVFTRGANNVGKGGDPDCPTLVAYTLDSSSTPADQTVDFVFDDSVLPSWYGTVTWAPEPTVVPVPATTVTEGTSGLLEWCDGFELDVLGDPVLDPFTDAPIPVLPAGESWCLVDQSSVLVSSGVMQVTQTIYGLTDPGFSRPR